MWYVGFKQSCEPVDLNINVFYNLKAINVIIALVIAAYGIAFLRRWWAKPIMWLLRPNNDAKKDKLTPAQKLKEYYDLGKA
jgi:hypothetical protein